MRKTVLFGIAIILLFVMVSPAAAVTNGQPDGPNHPYVGLIVFDDASGPAWRCSGALLSPTVFLTAGHCTDGAVAARVWFDSVMTDPKYPFGGGTSIEASDIITNPDYQSVPGHGLPKFDSHDVGVVILSQPKVLTSYAQLPTQDLVNTLLMNTEVTLVGYGGVYENRGIPPHLWHGSATRMFAPTLLIQSNDVISSEYIKLTANPAQSRGGTCFGDSGGPDLLGGTNIVLAVNSFVTNGNCAGVTYSNRIDTAYALEFIQSFLV